jgi:hypothetical protein
MGLCVLSRFLALEPTEGIANSDFNEGKKNRRAHKETPKFNSKS